jgi:hypothetical protein
MDKYRSSIKIHDGGSSGLVGTIILCSLTIVPLSILGRKHPDLNKDNFEQKTATDTAYISTAGSSSINTPKYEFNDWKYYMSSK